MRIDFNPTVPHCSLASLIGLCLRKKVLVGTFGDRIKLDIVISEGKHNTEEESKSSAPLSQCCCSSITQVFVLIAQSTSRSTTRRGWPQPWKIPASGTLSKIAF